LLLPKTGLYFGQLHGEFRVSSIQKSEELDPLDVLWELSHMTTLVRADEKGRVCIRGTKKGREYLVKAEPGGWWIRPVPKFRRPKKRQQWSEPAKDLSEHLQDMADLGFTFESSEPAKQKVGPCPF